MTTDTSDSSKTVQISGKEVMLKESASFKKSTGDEAATKGQGMNVVTHQIQGKCYFTSWSMDVKIEGENAVRHLDMMTHNHASGPGGAPPWPYQDMTAFGDVPECKADTEKAKTACAGSTQTQVGERKHHTDCSDECKAAMECILVPKGKDKEMCCSPDNTGDHLIEDHWVCPGGNLQPDFKHIANKPGGAYNGAPTMCVNRSRYKDKHGTAHGTRGVWEDTLGGKEFSYADGKAKAIESHADANPDAKCSKGCIEAQLDNYYGKDGNKKLQASDRKQPMKAEQREAALKRANSTADE